MGADSQMRLLCLGAILAPAAAGVISGYLGNGPSRAGAIMIEPMPDLPVIVPAAIATEASPIPVMASPFKFESEPAPEPRATLPQRPLPERRTEPEVEFLLTAVMPSPSRPLAVINGKARRIGDAVEPGWVLTMIDGDARRVILTHISGRTRTVEMATQAP